MFLKGERMVLYVSVVIFVLSLMYFIYMVAHAILDASKRRRLDNEVGVQDFHLINGQSFLKKPEKGVSKKMKVQQVPLY